MRFRMRMVSCARRCLMGWLLCHLRRHSWQHNRNLRLVAQRPFLTCARAAARSGRTTAFDHPGTLLLAADPLPGIAGCRTLVSAADRVRARVRAGPQPHRPMVARPPWRVLTPVRPEAPQPPAQW